jgi:hypothetical protein
MADEVDLPDAEDQLDDGPETPIEDAIVVTTHTNLRDDDE